MRVILNDFIGVRGRSGSSRGAALIAEAVSADGAFLKTLRPGREPRTKIMRLVNMIFWDFVYVPFRSRQLQGDIVVHATNTGISLGKSKSILVLHDTMVLDYPQMFNRKFVAYAKVFIWFSVRNSSLIVTPSQHSKRRIQSRWPETKVMVIPWPAYSEGRRGDLCDHDLPQSPLSSTVLVVSSVDKHKRLPLAVRAVREARAESMRDFRLVFVTRPGNDAASFEASLNFADPERNWISVCSGIDDSELSEMYRQAFCVLVSSVDEGFCLPALEASANGVPVVHTNRGALPEVIPRYLPSDLNSQDDGRLLVRQLLELTDDNIWRQHRDADRMHSKRFSKDNFSRKWIAALRDTEGS